MFSTSVTVHADTHSVRMILDGSVGVKSNVRRVYCSSGSYLALVSCIAVVPTYISWSRLRRLLETWEEEENIGAQERMHTNIQNIATNSTGRIYHTHGLRVAIADCGHEEGGIQESEWYGNESVEKSAWLSKWRYIDVAWVYLSCTYPHR